MKLQPLLSEYLFTNGKLPLPGIGCLQLQQVAATESEEGTQMTAPVVTILFNQNSDEKADEKLKAFISQYLKISGKQVQSLLEENNLRQFISATGEVYNWPSVGVFRQNENSMLSFQPDAFLKQYLPPISLIPIAPALPSSKPDTEHPEVTINQPSEKILPVSETPSEKHTPANRWWIGAVVIFVLSLLLIAYYYL